MAKDLKILADKNIPFVEKCFSSIGTVQLSAGRDMDPEMVRNADVLLVRSVTKINEQLLEGSTVKFVATATIGTDHIDEDYLAEKSIGFASAPGSNANSVAEYVTAGLLNAAQRAGTTLQNKKIGIIGCGNVGSRVQDKAAAMGMVTVANDPPLERQTGQDKYRPIEEIHSCDFVTVHTPLTFEGTDKTYHLCDKAFFDSLKTGCIFINTSRGAVVDTDALKMNLADGPVDRAVLDVWENEPRIDTGMLELAELASPHIAGYSFDGKVAGMIMIYRAACGFFGIEPKHQANDFLTAPQKPEIEIDPKGKSDHQLLAEAVAEVYDITADDADMRKMLDMNNQDERAGYFDSLRKKYRIRREFQNTVVRIKGQAASLREKMKGIGFNVS
jgi:erythronate-4-phosphate dehydrogenase